MTSNISLLHGAGGSESRDLIRDVFLTHLSARHGPEEDAAIIANGTLAISIDGFVVDPPDFPGGDIGKLAVCGTVNDLAVRGAEPRWMAVSWIIPEGMPVENLARYSASLATTAHEANIAVVTGDTKVVPSADLRGPVITTCGVGEVKKLSTIDAVTAGDVLIVSGRVAEHTTALLAAREGLLVDDLPPSDCALMHHLTAAAFTAGAHFARDMTRGGLAAVLWEIADACHTGLRVERGSIPVHPAVAELCSVVGLDPLYLANEGCVLIAARPDRVDDVLAAIRKEPTGVHASVIGQVLDSRKGVDILTDGKLLPLQANAVGLPRLC